jgi:PAS domain S-box-containing protein
MRMNTATNGTARWWKPRAFEHWNRNLGCLNRTKIQAWQTLGKRPVQGLDALIPGENPRLDRAVNWVNTRIEVLQTTPSHFMEQIIESANDGIITINSEGKMSYINKKLLDLTGYRLEEVLERGPWEFVHEDYVNMVLESIQKVLAGDIMDPTEVVIIKKNKEELDAEFTAALLTSPSGKKMIGVVIRDITQRKRMERALERANAELDAFARTAAHDLKGPLQRLRAIIDTLLVTDLAEMDAICDRLETIVEPFDRVTRKLIQVMIEQKKAAGARFLRNLDLLKKDAEALEQLVHGILEYSRSGGEIENIEEVVVSTLLNEIINSLPKPSEGFVVEIGKMPTFLTERTLLKQVFLNLINNAFNCHDRPDRGMVGITMRERDDFYEFAVADDGPGISPAYQGKIFKLYEGKGSGIGLATVLKIIKRVGGTIRVESEEGKGARFIFTWPKNLK